MPDSLFEICKKAVDCLEDTLKQWTVTFGTELYESWDDPDKAIQRLVTKVWDLLDRKFDRQGAGSLFIRVPISDRLTLVCSTVKELCPGGNPEPWHFADMDNNYDREMKVAYYDLCDRLCPCRGDDKAREKRGLTGWVAVTGHPVLLNHENDKVALDRFSSDHPKSANKCDDYRQPVWSQRISEFHPEELAGNRRFVAVPIQSVVDSNKTIGVIRYSCSDQYPEITGFDQGLLEGAASIISALENLKRVKTRSSRVLLAEAKARQFESDGDFSEYLAFIAKHTMSEIASLYISLGPKENARLRLVDAFGLSKPIRNLRQKNRLRDYTHAKPGLTWRMQYHDFTSYPSVAAADGWTGLNTSVFYEKAFRRVGLLNFATRSREEQMQLVGDYRIQLLGGRLRIQSGTVPETCGVLKVEFPRVYDADSLYDKDDIEFLKTCSDVLAQELHRYRQLYDGSWFHDAGPEKATEFLRLLSGVARTNLFKGLDRKWQKPAANYLHENGSAIEAAVHGSELRLPKPETDWKSKLVVFLKTAGKTVAKTAAKTALKTAETELFNELMKILEHMFFPN